MPPANTTEIAQQRLKKLIKFSENIGKKFYVKGTNLVDTIEGVDRRYDHVRGKDYGNFHVDKCELVD